MEPALELCMKMQRNFGVNKEWENVDALIRVVPPSLSVPFGGLEDFFIE